MIHRWIIGALVAAVGCGSVWFALSLSNRPQTHEEFLTNASAPNPRLSRHASANPGSGRVNELNGDSRSLNPPVRAHDNEMVRPPEVVAILERANEQLAPADIQTLLAFISSPKPGELTDGEWEERVNGVLNLLRRQEVSSFQFQVLSGKENDGGEPQGQVRNPSAETSVTSASPRFVSDTDGVSTLRKGAIHAIGQLGTAEDLAVLDSLPQDDLNLSQALLPAKAALTTRTKAAR